MTEQLLDVSTIARRWSVSTATVYRLIKRKEIRAVKRGVSQGIRVSRRELEKYELQRDILYHGT